MFRAISRKPMPPAWAVLIYSQMSAEILLRTVRFSNGNCPFSRWLMFK